jgi:hypothetical protein
MVTRNGDLLARQAREAGAPLAAPRGRRRGKHSKAWLARRAKEKGERADAN